MPERDLRLYLEDILDSGNAVVQFVEGLSYEEFRDDRKTYSAVIREFEIIGEKLKERLTAPGVTHLTAENAEGSGFMNRRERRRFIKGLALRAEKYSGY